MLFSSSIFLFVFLPLVVLIFYGIRRWLGFMPARYFLILASLFFYGYWNPVYLLLILGSIAFNLYVSRRVTAARLAEAGGKSWLLLGIVFNIGLLGYFKYSIFFANSFLSLVSGIPLFVEITLPLAISFFTFQQIAFLVDGYKKPRAVEATRWDAYILFVTFFPQLIAGPIVHHKSLVPQLNEDTLGRTSRGLFVLGLCMFFMGLFKKVVIADELARLSGPVFIKLADGHALSATDAWLGILVYTFRLYFDFSAYSDMAFALALMFGVILPINFFSPYKAGNINETWQRWNITLGNFFGNYVFKPLGGRKRGHVIAVRNLMIIMLLSGMWHGAGWNYLLWGVMQGSAMGIAFLWPYFMRGAGLGAIREKVWYRDYLAVGLTFTFWVFSLVAFRVTNVNDIWAFYGAMLSVQWQDLLQLWNGLASGVQHYLGALQGGESFRRSAEFRSVVSLIICFPLVFAAPNVFQYFGVTRNGRLGHASVSSWQALWVGVLAAIAVSKVVSGATSDFIYFAF